MTMQKQITQKLTQSFNPSHLEVINESHQHSGPRTESHFKVVMVSNLFAGQRLIQRHQAVHKSLSEELKQIHALSLKLYTETEWQESEVPESPACGGRHK